jgi:hypothetical protein
MGMEPDLLRPPILLILLSLQVVPLPSVMLSGTQGRASLFPSFMRSSPGNMEQPEFVTG